jgi:hypothetical protein
MYTSSLRSLRSIAKALDRGRGTVINPNKAYLYHEQWVLSIFIIN